MVKNISHKEILWTTPNYKIGNSQKMNYSMYKCLDIDTYKQFW